MILEILFFIELRDAGARSLVMPLPIERLVASTTSLAEAAGGGEVGHRPERSGQVLPA